MSFWLCFLSMASKIKVRGIISIAWFIELGSIFGIEDSAANMKKTHTFYLWKIESWNYEQDDTRKDKFSMSHKNVAPSDAISLLSNFIVCCTSSYRLVFSMCRMFDSLKCTSLSCLGHPVSRIFFLLKNFF